VSALQGRYRPRRSWARCAAHRQGSQRRPVKPAHAPRSARARLDARSRRADRRRRAHAGKRRGGKSRSWRTIVRARESTSSARTTARRTTLSREPGKAVPTGPSGSTNPSLMRAPRPSRGR